MSGDADGAVPGERPRRPGRWRKIVRLAPVRLVIGLAILVAGTILAQVGLVGLRALGLDGDLRSAIETVVAVATSVLLYLAFVRWIEGRRPTELYRAPAVRETGVGLVLGVVLFSTSIGVIALLGGYRVSGVDPGWNLAPAAALAISSGVSEEILIRGVVFRLLDEWLGSWAALAISAVLFGALHLANPHATWASSIAIALEAGILLAAAYLVTRRLWLPIGMHIAWNFTQAGIFGVAVSGHESHGILRGAPAGPDWLSGGEFGAEASVVSVLVCLAAALILLGLALRAGRIVAPSWRRAPPVGGVEG